MEICRGANPGDNKSFASCAASKKEPAQRLPTLLFVSTEKPFEPAPIGSKPRREVLLFPFGKTHTKQYGTLEFDHADAIEVMHHFEQRGVRVPWDVEHATAKGGPTQWQDSHGWSVLFVDEEGLKTAVDWNPAGQAQLSGLKRIYDSPEVTLWRGNHVRAVPALSLVTEPARNHSTPLLMNGSANTAPAAPSRQSYLSTIHGTLGPFLEAFQQPGVDADIKAVGEKIAGLIKDDAAQINAWLQEAGGPLGSASQAEGEKPAAPVVQMSASSAVKADPLAELGAEFMTALGAKSAEEARGILRAMRENHTALMSARTELADALVKIGQHEGKVKLDEVDELKAKTPDFLRALLSGRSPNVNTAPAAAPARREEPVEQKSAADTDIETRMNASLKSTKIGASK